MGGELACRGEDEAAFSGCRRTLHLRTLVPEPTDPGTDELLVPTLVREARVEQCLVRRIRLLSLYELLHPLVRQT